MRPFISDKPVKRPQRSVRLPESPNSTPVTCWLPARMVAPVVASVVFALVFSVWNTAAVANRLLLRSHFVPASRLRLRSGGSAVLLTPVAARVSPKAPSYDGLNDVL